MNKFTLAILLGVNVSASAQTLSSPGPSLNMLQQIQGAWQSQCHPQPADLGSGFQQIRLTVRFTHFLFVTEEFDEPDCRIKRAESKARYRFILRDPFINQQQETLFAIDFHAEEIPPGVVPLHPLNVISYKSGTLYLGEPAVADSKERLQKLNRTIFFSR